MNARSVVTDGSSHTRVIEFAAGLRTSPDDRQPIMAARRVISGDTALGVQIVLTDRDIANRAVPARNTLWLTYGLIVGLVAILAARALMWDWHGALQLALYADHRIYMDAAERIRAGGPWYPAWQLAGPYGLERNPELYPPATLALLILPMSFLPAVLWWVVPLGIIAGCVAYHRPSALGWALILLTFVPPWSWNRIASGGVYMWIAAAVAVGTIRPSLSVLGVLKPSLFPFALIGIRSRGWWVGVAMLGLLSLALLPQTLDYIRVMANLSGGSLLYSLHDVPLMLVPLIAAWSRTRATPLPR